MFAETSVDLCRFGRVKIESIDGTDLALDCASLVAKITGAEALCTKQLAVA